MPPIQPLIAPIAPILINKDDESDEDEFVDV